MVSGKNAGFEDWRIGILALSGKVHLSGPHFLHLSNEGAEPNGMLTSFQLNTYVEASSKKAEKCPS